MINLESERKKESEVTQLCATPCDPTDCSLPGSSIHGIFQARVLEWGAIAFSVDFILGGSKITADGDCSHEIKTLTPWKESYDQPR